MKKYFLILLITLTNIFNSFAQDYSNKGREFYIAYPAHIDVTDSYMGIYITSDQNASGNIQVGSIVLPFTVTAKQVTKKLLGSSGTIDASNTSVYLSQQDGIKQNAAIKVTSDVPVVVYAHIIKNARSGATLVLPTPVLGTEYMIPNYPSNGTSGGTEQPNVPLLAVVATLPNTTIEINPTIAGRAGKPANTPFQITLQNAGDCYQFQGAPTGDLSGTTVKSISTSTTGCKPIAVFAGSTWSAFDCQGASGGDNLYQELFPMRSWGKKFITSPFIYRLYDIFRIYVKDPTTVVTVTENGVTQNLTTYQSQGKFYEISTKNALYIDADKPISVVQFMTSTTCKTGCSTSSSNKTCQADPEMVVLNPVEQTLKDITFFSANNNSTTGLGSITNVTNNYVNIIIDKRYKNTVKIDNAAPNGTFIDIAGTNYSYLQEDITASTNSNPVHNVVADTGFSAIVYGTGNVESYGYNGGTNVVDLYQYISLKNQYATVNFPATCVDAPFQFSITLPYQPLKINWDFNNYSALSPNTNISTSNPVADSSFIKDGKTLYVYKLPGTYKFSAIGSYPIKVIVNNPTSDGCNGDQEIIYDVQVYKKPVANYTVTTNGCATSPVLFFDNSFTDSRPIIKYVWDFGDATKDSVKNPVKTYTTANTFNVHYSIITDIGCIADTIKTLTLSTPPVAKFAADSNYCLGSVVKFIDSSNAPTPSTLAKWYWDYGNGKKDTFNTKTSPSIVYTSTGKYTVTLVVETSTGCKSFVFSKDVFIRPNPIVDFTMPTVVCLPVGAAAFINASTIADGTQGSFSYKWYFGNSDSSIQKDGATTYNAVANYSVKLIVTSLYGCKKDTTKTFANVYAQPKANFATASEICLRDTAFFSDNSNPFGSTITQWYWSFGDGATASTQNPNHLYATATTDTVKLFIITNKGCISDTANKAITINPLPVAGFTVGNPTCEKRLITFTDTSKANVGNIATWGWNMGNGHTYNFTSLPNPFTEIYDTTGTYNVRMMVTNSKGCKSDSSVVHSITINPLPQVAYILPKICIDDAVAHFVDTSKIALNPPNTLQTYLWNFGDKNATVVNPNFSNTPLTATHTYTDTGNYRSVLTITSNYGCKDSLVQYFTVNGSTPVANFSVLNAANLCSNDSVRIQNTSTVNFGNITQVEIYWDTANNLLHKTIDNNPTKNKVYSTVYNSFQQPANKVVYVKMYAYSGITCVSEKTVAVTLQQAPKVQFVPMASVCNEVTNRIITEAKEIGNVAGTGVFTGAGIINALTGELNATILTPNTYSITYTYTSNNFACVDKVSQTITVLPSPKAKFGTSSIVCEKNAVTFYDSSTATPNQNIITWNWIFGNGTSAIKNSANPFAITYNNHNNYYVTLKVNTDSGCSNSITNIITVHPLPKVNFILPTAVCLPLGKAEFKDTSTIVDTTQMFFSYLWNFGDANNGTTSTSATPTHYYSALDTPVVMLIVTSKFGCIDSLPKKLYTIFPQPKANFTWNPDTIRCINQNIDFTDKSDGKTSAVNVWNWQFGNLGTSNVQNPSFIFTDSGYVPVSLHIVNAQGCPSDTFTIRTTIYPYPKLDLPTTVNFLQGQSLVLKPNYIYGQNLTYLWTPNVSISNTKILTPNVYPSSDLTYKLTITGIGKCSVSDEVKVVVLEMPEIPSAFSPNGDGINDTWIIKYLNKYPGCTVTVFDRYGQKLFSSLGYSKPWDGTYNGKPAPIGVYYYIIEPYNGRGVMTGSVTILR